MATKEKKKFRRYLIIEVDYEIDCTQTDQDPADHEEEIAEYVQENLSYAVRFDSKVEAGDDSSNCIEVPVKILGTEVIGFTDSKPLDCV